MPGWIDDAVAALDDPLIRALLCPDGQDLHARACGMVAVPGSCWWPVRDPDGEIVGLAASNHGLRTRSCWRR